MKSKFLHTVATLAVFTAVNTAMAADPLLSPRAQALADSLRTGSGSTPDLIVRAALSGTPKGRDQAYSLRKVPSADAGIDLAHGQRTLLSPKDPRYETAPGELRAREFHVAPLK